MQITVNDIAINYRFDGPEDAPVVTFSNSLATTLAMWAPQVAALADRYRILRYDTRGHGATSAPDGPYALADLARDTRLLLEALGIARTHFVGLSLGGMIAQMLAIHHPEMLASVSLCDTTSRMPPETDGAWDARIATAETEGMSALVDGTLERWFTAPFRAAGAAAVDQVRAAILATPAAGYAGCCHAIRGLDLTDRLAAVEMPTLIVVGADDMGTPVAASEAMHARIAGAELVVIDDAAHLSNLEQPAAFNRALGDFLDARAAA